MLSRGVVLSGNCSMQDLFPMQMCLRGRLLFLVFVWLGRNVTAAGL
jgi:hypothetical protein